MKVKFDPLSLFEYMGSKPIKVADKNPNYPIQIELFSEFSKFKYRKLYNKCIGNFYEILTNAIFGGEWRGTSNSSWDDEWSFHPDVITKDRIIDSKGVCWSQGCKLPDFQIHKYLVQQCDASFMPSKRIFHAMYKYFLKSPWKYFDQFKENTLDYIVKTLSNQTAFMLFLPFSIVFNIHNPNLISKGKYRYDGDKYDNMTIFTGPAMKKMLLQPQEIMELFQLSPEDYNITRTWLSEEMKMNNCPIKPFPILFVENRDYESWLGRFKKDNSGQVEILKQEKRTRDEYRMREEGSSDLNLDEEVPEVSQGDIDDIPF